MKEKIERWVWTAEGMVPYRAHPLNVGGYFVNGSDYDALAERLPALTEKYQGLVAFYDQHVGTPCEQIRHEQEVSEWQEKVHALIEDFNTVQAENARLRAALANRT